MNKWSEFSAVTRNLTQDLIAFSYFMIAVLMHIEEGGIHAVANVSDLVISYNGWRQHKSWWRKENECKQGEGDLWCNHYLHVSVMTLLPGKVRMSAERCNNAMKYDNLSEATSSQWRQLLSVLFFCIFSFLFFWQKCRLKCTARNDAEAT